MIPSLLAAAALAAEPAAPEPNKWEKQWHAAVDAKDAPKAKSLCEGWLSQADKAPRTEAHKCLASLAAGQGETDAALKELDAAIKLSPEDLSAHEARLQVAVGARRFDDLPKLLESSLKDYPKPDGLEAWLDVSAGLMEDERFEEGLAYTKVLEKAFAKDHRVPANVGTFLAALERREEALPYLKRAVASAPGDALDNWNLGKLYDEMGKADLAEKFYMKSLALPCEPAQKKESQCLYAEFLRKHKRPNAAQYEKKNCPEGVPEEEQ